MSEVAEVGGVNRDDALARLDRLLAELEGVLVPARARKAARADVATARRRRLVEVAPEEVQELEQLVSELPRPGCNGHGRHG